MKGNFIKKISFIALSFLCLFGFTSCRQAHECSPGQYKSNETSHWHECEGCGKILDSGDHTIREVVIQEGNCTTDGIVKYACSECGYSKTETTPAPGHDLEHHNAKESTCAEEGNLEYYICKSCNKVFDANMNETSLAAVKLPALGHVPGALVPATEQTCTTEGHGAYYECAVCHEKFDDQACTKPYTGGVLPATGHDYGTLVTKKEATCTEDGYEAHFYCSLCNKYFTADKKETTLDAITIKAVGHGTPIYHSYVAPTCERAGANECYECPTCHDLFEDEALTIAYTGTTLPALGHKYGSLIAEVPPTCTAEGVAAHYECSTCHELFIKDGSTYKKVTLDELKTPVVHKVGDHYNIVEPSCLTTGIRDHYSCSECGCNLVLENDKYIKVTDEELIIPATGHTYKSVPKVEATCGAMGMEAHYECENCELVFNKTADKYNVVDIDTLYIDALPHAHMTHINDTKPTCTEVGYYDCYYCSDCEQYFTDIDGFEDYPGSPIKPATGHLHVSHYDAIPVECEADGQVEYWQCDDCHKAYSDAQYKHEINIDDVVIEKTGHSTAGYKYQLIDTLDNLHDTNDILVVAFDGTNYYGLSRNTSFGASEKLTVDGSYLYAQNPMNLTTTASLKTEGLYCFYFETDPAVKGKFLGSSTSEGSSTAYDDSNSKNSTNWVVTFADNNKVTAEAKGTNSAKYLAFNKSTKKFGCAKAFAGNYIEVYFYKYVSTDIHEVRVSDTEFAKYYTCKTCGANYDDTGYKVSVSLAYQLVKGTDNYIKNGDKIIVGSYYGYYAVGSENSGKGLVSTTGKIVNDKITDTTGIQIFNIKNGYTSSTVRLLRNGYYTQLISTPAKPANMYYSNPGNKSYEPNCIKSGSLDQTFAADGKATLINTINSTDRPYGNLVYSPADGVFKMLQNYTAASSEATDARYLKLYRQVYIIRDLIGDLIPYQAPTCEQDGMLEHYFSEGVYYDADHNVVDVNTLIIPKLGHEYGEYEHVFGTETHQRVCINDPEHILLEPCTYESGKCKYCGSDKATVHIHAYNLKTMNASTLISEKTCSDYAKYYYSCSCGQHSTDIFEDVAGGKLPHTLKTVSYEATCTEEGAVNKTYCTVCNEVISIDKVLEALGHDYKIEGFEFNNLSSYDDTTGVWTEKCSRCGATHKVDGDMTYRPGSSDWAFEQLADGKFYDGTDFHFGDDPNLLFTSGFPLYKFARSFYKKLFIVCENMMHSTKDYDSGTMSAVKPVSLANTSIPEGLTKSTVSYFLRKITEYFKSDHPEYYFLCADKWSYGSSVSSTTTIYSYYPYMYQAFWKYEDRKAYQEGFDEVIAQYKGFFEKKYPNENDRMSAIYKYVINKITYTYGGERGPAKAPNTIVPLLDGQGVCESYALSMVYLCRMNGLEAHEAASPTHAWVFGKVNGNWYQFDPTWGDSTSYSTNNKYYGFLKAEDVDSSSGDSHVINPQWMHFPAVASSKLAMSKNI